MPNINRDFPTNLVIFGSTGDLMSKKIVPALYDLYQNKSLPQLFNVIGFSRRDYDTAKFRQHVREILLKYLKLEKLDQEHEKFLKKFNFEQGHFDQKENYETLGKRLGQVDHEWRLCSNKLFYLAVPPEHYAGIFKLLKETDLTKPCSPEEGWTRVIVEKPFGQDFKTAEELDRLLSNLFNEVQIYRIDHYLAKEMLRFILSFRFGNNLLEANWDNTAIEKIELKIWENLGVEQRGAFYDGVGAFRDVGQNHLLQMLALITMEQPSSFDSDEIRARRVELLRKLKIPTEKEIKETSFRAQYEGYQSIPNVKTDSTTETYFKVKAQIDSERWRGVDIFIESGKRLGKPRKEIVVTYKHSEPCLCTPGGEHFQNKVIFSLEPHEGMKISFWSKKPGLSMEMQERDFNFTLRDPHEKKQYIEEYQKLLLDCINGDQTLFVSTDEIKAMWRFSDPVNFAWNKNLVPLKTYKPDTSTITEESMIIQQPKKINVIPKTFGLIGLGKMGAGMARQLTEKNWRVIAWNRTHDVTQTLAKENSNLIPTASISELLHKLPNPKVVWLMVPAGEVVDEMLFGKEGLIHQLKRGDIIIDGGNSFYKDAIRRGKKLAKKGIKFLDVGTSGGPGGARHGACLMIGGDRKIYEYLEPLLKDFAKPGAYQYFEGLGAGHFVKMIHNGIEYGMMQSLAEGFAVLKKSRYKLNLIDVTKIYNNGSVIESRLVGWLKQGFEHHGENLKELPGKVGHTGEGLWTVKTAQELNIPAKVIEDSYKFRVASAKKPSYTGKILMALREAFGGHKK